MAVCAAAFMAVGVAQGQVAINSTNFTQVGDVFTFTNNFNSYAGTAAPTNWSVTGSNYLGTDSGTANAGGIRALGTTGEYSLGFLGNGGTPSYTASISFENSTGLTITELTLSFDYELWRQLSGSNRQSTMVFSDTNSIGFNNFTVGGDAVNATSAGAYTSSLAASGTNTGSMFEQATFTQTLTGLNIVDGATFGFSFTYDRGASAGSGQSIGLDNFAMSATAIPEPSTYALLGLGVGALIWLRRRRAAAADQQA